MQDYKIAKLFSIPFKVRRINHSQEIIWRPPFGDTVKLNCDGSSIGDHPCGSIGVVLRSATSTFLGAISSNIGHATSLEAELCACMSAIEKAQAMHFINICLETDSIKVVNAFNKDIGIPWKLRARWFNCMKYCRSITCSCVHIHREGNMVADALAKNGQGLSLHSTQWWPAPPPFITSILLRDSLGLPYNRIMMT